MHTEEAESYVRVYVEVHYLGATYFVWFGVFLLRFFDRSSRPKRHRLRHEKQLKTQR
jgi:threonine/homoserine/homoserine lactone efflux protein